MKTLLLEIGAEEIPAGYIEPALKALSSTLIQKLDQARIDHGAARVFGTPKRLAVMISDVAEKQNPLSTEIIGPPAKIGFDENGAPTVAAEKFAEKNNIAISEITVKSTEKGDYICALKTETGKESMAVLQDIIPNAILAVPFPKTMKWADFHIFFARPIQSVVALFGEDVIPFKLENIESGRTTAGHRFMHPRKVEIGSPEDYVDALRKAYVIVDIEERKETIRKEITETARNLGGAILPDEELLDIVKNLVEYSAVVSGTFDTKFLELPDEVLITSMREHQKYFAVIDDNNSLMPYFIAVNNTQAKDMQLVAKGHERVLLARLEDARFFYKSDLDILFGVWIERLNGVLFQAKLGSMYEKIMRVQRIAEYIAEKTDPERKKYAARAALLSKADLVSQVVVEFPKLQGVMGRVYAVHVNEPEEVAQAIEEHYRPAYSGGPLPETLTGSITAIADKIDSICGCFSVGLIPTGAADPYALRRQAIGIIHIMLKNNFSLSLTQLIDNSMQNFNENSDKDPNEMKNAADAVYFFFQNRISHLLAEEGFSKDVIAAVVDISVDEIPQVWNRVRALENLKKQPDFEPLAIAFKRVVNIIKKENQTDIIAEHKNVDETLFEHDSEKQLIGAFKSVESKVDAHLKNGDFEPALHEIASLRIPVDNFFDNVLVMAEDQNIRNNRLALLGMIADMFARFADFSKITT